MKEANHERSWDKGEGKKLTGHEVGPGQGRVVRLEWRGREKRLDGWAKLGLGAAVLAVVPVNVVA